MMSFSEETMDVDWKPGTLLETTGEMPLWPLRPDLPSSLHITVGPGVVAMVISVVFEDSDYLFADITLLVGKELYVFSLENHATGIPLKPIKK